MRAMGLVVLAVMFSFAGSVLTAQAQDAAGVAVKTESALGFGGIVAQGASATMTVEAIDKESRKVTLKDDKGETSVVKCGPEVRNFDQIAVGDTVKIDLVQSVSIMVSGEKTSPSRSESVEMERAALGEKPSGTITKTIEATAVVKEIDHASRTVTLEGPQKTLTVMVDKSATNFDKVKIGDMVNIEVVETLAIAVTK